MAGIRINSNNFNGESVEITFNPFSGGTINLGTQTIPYDYLSSNYEGNYSIYIPSANKTCPLQVGVAPSPTPSITPTSTITPTPTITPTNTQTPTPSITPSASVPAGDPDANAYLADVVASGGTTNPTIEAAVQTLFTDLKSAGLYSKIDLMYPFVGSHAINALGNKTYDIIWNGGMTHGVSGSTGNGVNAWGNLTFSINDLTDRTLGSWGLYITQENTNNGAHGNFDADRHILGPYRTTSTNTYCWSKTPSPAIGVPPIVDGNHTMVRTGTTEFAVYINETQYTTALGYDGSNASSIMSLFVFTKDCGHVCL